MSYCSTQCMNQCKNLLWNPKGSSAVSIERNKLIMYNGNTKQPIAETTATNIHDVQFNPEGTRLMFKAFYSSIQATVLCLCDGHNGKSIIEIPTTPTAKIKFTPDSKTISILLQSTLPNQQCLPCYYDAAHGNSINLPSLTEHLKKFIGNSLFNIEKKTLCLYNNEGSLTYTMPLTDILNISLDEKDHADIVEYINLLRKQQQ